MTVKVLHAISTLDPINGGPVNAIEGLTSALVKSGVKVEILAPYRKGEDTSVADRLQQRGITITRVGPARTPIGYHPKMKATAIQAVSRNDIVHIHALWEEVQHHAARASQILEKPYIIRPCGMLDPWSLKQSWLRKKIYMEIRLRKNLNRASALHFTAEAERDLTKPLNLDAPTIIKPNGLELSEFGNLPPEGTFRNAYPELGDRPYVLFLSRIHHKKGLNLLVPAFAQAAPQDYSLVIAGPGDPQYVAKIKNLVNNHGLTDRVMFPGMLSGQIKLAAYAEAELFALPSYQENFGIVIIESLACGTPVATTTAVNLADQLKEKPFALISSPEVKGFTAVLKSFFTNPKINSNVQQDAKEFIHNKFGWESIAEDWHKYYQLRVDQKANL